MTTIQKANLFKAFLFMLSASLFAIGLLGCEKKQKVDTPSAASVPMKRTANEMPGARPIQAASVPTAPSIEELKKTAIEPASASSS